MSMVGKGPKVSVRIGLELRGFSKYEFKVARKGSTRDIAIGRRW